MKTTKILIGAVGVLVLLNVILITFLFAGRPHPPSDHDRGGYGHKGKHPREHHMKHFMKHRLDLNDTQIEQAMELKNEHMEFVQKQNTTLRALNKKFFDCVTDSACGDKEAVYNEIQDLHQQIMKNRYVHFEKMLSLVEADKQDELKKMLIRMSNMEPKHQKHSKHQKHPKKEHKK